MHDRKNGAKEDYMNKLQKKHTTSLTRELTGDWTNDWVN